MFIEKKLKKRFFFCENKICTGTEAGGPIYSGEYSVFVVFRIKCHFTATGGVSGRFVTVMTPPQMRFYLLGEVARSIGRV